MAVYAFNHKSLLITIILLSDINHLLYNWRKIFLLNKTTSMDQTQLEEKFKPKGAMAFFVLLVVLCLVIWFGIYFLMLGRI